MSGVVSVWVREPPENRRDARSLNHGHPFVVPGVLACLSQRFDAHQPLKAQAEGEQADVGGAADLPAGVGDNRGGARIPFLAGGGRLPCVLLRTCRAFARARHASANRWPERLSGPRFDNHQEHAGRHAPGQFGAGKTFPAGASSPEIWLRLSRRLTSADGMAKPTLEYVGPTSLALATPTTAPC